MAGFSLQLISPNYLRLPTISSGFTQASKSSELHIPNELPSFKVVPFL
jgi:hypothetical protein